jgi:hypothetical protein
MLSCSATELGLDVLEALFMKVHLLLDLTSLLGEFWSGLLQL